MRRTTCSVVRSILPLLSKMLALLLCFSKKLVSDYSTKVWWYKHLIYVFLYWWKLGLFAIYFVIRFVSTEQNIFNENDNLSRSLYLGYIKCYIHTLLTDLKIYLASFVFWLNCNLQEHKLTTVPMSILQVRSRGH